MKKEDESYPGKDFSDGILLKLLRENDGLSQKSFAEKLGISAYRLRKIEQDKEEVKSLNKKSLKKLKKLIDYPLGLFLIDNADPRFDIYVGLKKMMISTMKGLASFKKERAKRRKKKRASA